MATVSLSVPQSGDTVAAQGAAQYREGVTGGNLDSTGGVAVSAISAGDGRWERRVKRAAVTCSGATTTESNFIPAGAVVQALTGVVTTLVAGATSFDVGDGSDADIFGDGVLVALGTSFDLTDANASGSPLGGRQVYQAANDVVLTAIGGAASFSAGVVELELWYDLYVAPTS